MGIADLSLHPSRESLLRHGDSGSVGAAIALATQLRLWSFVAEGMAAHVRRADGTTLVRALPSAEKTGKAVGNAAGVVCRVMVSAEEEEGAGGNKQSPQSFSLHRHIFTLDRAAATTSTTGGCDATV